MGRVTVFAIDSCPHCKRAKAALTARGIPFTEISLSSYPSKSYEFGFNVHFCF